MHKCLIWEEPIFNWHTKNKLAFLETGSQQTKWLSSGKKQKVNTTNVRELTKSGCIKANLWSCFYGKSTNMPQEKDAEKILSSSKSRCTSTWTFLCQLCAYSQLRVNKFGKRLLDFIPRWHLFFWIHKHRYFKCNKLDCINIYCPTIPTLPIRITWTRL